MPTRSSLSRADVLLFGALLALAACDGQGAAPPGVARDPTLTEDADSAEADQDAERVDSGSRADAGVRDASARDASRLDGNAPVEEGDDAGEDVEDGSRPDASSMQPDAGPKVPLSELWAIERLLVADGRSSSVYAVDAKAGRVLDTFALTAPGSVHAGPGGRYGYVLEPGADVVHVVDMGLLATPDPSTHELTQSVQLLTPAVQGAKPQGFAAQGDANVALFFAGGAQVVSLHDDASAVRDRAASFAAGQPHGGFVLGLGSELLTTRVENSVEGTVLTRLDASLREMTTPAWGCSDPSAGAVSGTVAAVACREGLLRYTAGGKAGQLVPYPATATSPAPRAERLVPHASQGAFLALFEDRVCLIREGFVCAPQPAGGVADLSFDLTGKRVLVLTLDGVLHLLDRSSLAQLSEVALFTPPSAPAPEAERPALALGRSVLYVSDPQAQRIQRVDPANGSVLDSIMIPGAMPTKLAVFRHPY